MAVFDLLSTCMAVFVLLSETPINIIIKLKKMHGSVSSAEHFGMCLHGKLILLAEH